MSVMPERPEMPQRTLLYLIRHAEPAEEFHDRFYGQLDVPLSERGVEQSRRTAEKLGAIKFDAVYSSDLQRARILAENLADPLELPVRQLEVFRERHFGIFQGMTLAEMEAFDAETFHEWNKDRIRRRVEGGESFEDLQNRVMPGIKMLVESFAGARIALVAHGGPIRVFLANVLGMPLENVFRINLDYACVSVVEFPLNGGQPRVKLVNG